MWITLKELIQLVDERVALLHSGFHEFSHFVAFKSVLSDQHIKYLSIAFDCIQITVKLSVVFFEALDLLPNSMKQGDSNEIGLFGPGIYGLLEV